MAFSYDPTTDVGTMRLELGDTHIGTGVRPDGQNLSDEELTVWLTREGSVMRGVAAACEALSRMWSPIATISVGPHSETLGTISEVWADRAKALRETYGYGDEEAAGVVGGFSVESKREDEYS